MGLARYRTKRDFSETPEPSGAAKKKRSVKQPSLSFVVQLHHASHVHYDFRLELDGVLKSWAVPKGPSYDPKDRRLAVEVEDHPLEYAGFEGIIPQGQYGGGTVIVWDRGTWTPLEGHDPHEGLRKGSLKFRLEGEKLVGGWTLVRMKDDPGSGKHHWLLIKERDDTARDREALDVTAKLPRSVLSKKTIEQIAKGGEGTRTWDSDRPTKTKAKSTRARTKTPGRRSPAPPAAVEMPTGARRAAIPRSFSPQLATLVDEVPGGEEWFHEVKFDGYRILAFVEGGLVRLLTRNDHDWSSRFVEVRDAVAELGLPDCILDGEVVALGTNGVSSFQALQGALTDGTTGQLAYYVFDMPFFDGHDLTAVPLRERVRLLREALGGLPKDGRVRVSEHITGTGPGVLRTACRLGLEGIVSKRADGTYTSARTPDWRKTKCGHRQEFVVLGTTEPKGARSGFGSLLLGYYDDGGELVYAGKVGAGFDEADLRALAKRFRSLEREESALADAPRLRDATWIEPRIVAEVSFTEWTTDGRLRHPVFLGVREDKEAKDVKREATGEPSPRSARTRESRVSPRGPDPKKRPAPRTPAAAPDHDAIVAGVTVTHPDRVVYQGQGLTKLEVVRYYERVGELIMPHAMNRPLSLVRCPGGSGSKCFFHKHVDTEGFTGLKAVPVMESGGEALYVAATAISGLIGLAQMNTLEFHGWQARADNIERPDRIVIDLDPAEGLAWERIPQAARRVRGVFEEMGMTCYVMASGGKGLHVVVPIARSYTWEEIKAFAHELAKAMASAEPEKYTATLSKSARVGRVFVDYLRNQRGATSILPYSTRAREGAPVAMPIEWDEIDLVRPNQFTVANIDEHLDVRKRDPWKGFFDRPKALPRSVVPKVG